MSYLTACHAENGHCWSFDTAQLSQEEGRTQKTNWLHDLTHHWIEFYEIESIREQVLWKCKNVCLALRTDVIERPLLTRVSAIQPPTLANTAIVNHGKTHSSPDSVRLNFNTWNNWNDLFYLFVKKAFNHMWSWSTCLIVISGHPCQEYECSPIMAEVRNYERPDGGFRQNQLPWNDCNRFPWFATSEYNLLFFFT